MDANNVVVLIVLVSMQLIPFCHAIYQIIEKKIQTSNGNPAVPFRADDRALLKDVFKVVKKISEEQHLRQRANSNESVYNN